MSQNRHRLKRPRPFRVAVQIVRTKVRPVQFNGDYRLTHQIAGSEPKLITWARVFDSFGIALILPDEAPPQFGIGR